MSGRSSWISTVDGRLPAPVKWQFVLSHFLLTVGFGNIAASELARFLNPSTVCMLKIVFRWFPKGKILQANGQSKPLARLLRGQSHESARWSVDRFLVR